jgi:RimJ/RimL family protein N-acetyltransferase
MVITSDTIEGPPFQPFAILTPRLVLLPTPLAVSVAAYAALYAELHADPAFCTMAFGDSESSFKPVDWTTDNLVLKKIEQEVYRSWDVRGMGDFAVGLLDGVGLGNHMHSEGYSSVSEGCAVIEGEAYEQVLDLQNITWIGYAGVRDATTTSIPVWGETTQPGQFPPWQEMIELRYGFHSSAWGKGYGSEAAKAVMKWCEEKRGATRFISECEKANMGSSGVLRRMGFVQRDDLQFWGMDTTVEWERRVGVEAP